MYHKLSANLYNIGRLLLGLMIVFTVFLLIRGGIGLVSQLDDTAYISNQLSLRIASAVGILLLGDITLIMLVLVFIYVKNYPIRVGAILLGLGVISIILMFIYPLGDVGGGGVELKWSNKTGHKKGLA